MSREKCCRNNKSIFDGHSCGVNLIRQMQLGEVNTEAGFEVNVWPVRPLFYISFIGDWIDNPKKKYINLQMMKDVVECNDEQTCSKYFDYSIQLLIDEIKDYKFKFMTSLWKFTSFCDINFYTNDFKKDGLFFENLALTYPDVIFDGIIKVDLSVDSIGNAADTYPVGVPINNGYTRLFIPKNLIFEASPDNFVTPANIIRKVYPGNKYILMNAPCYLDIYVYVMFKNVTTQGDRTGKLQISIRTDAYKFLRLAPDSAPFYGYNPGHVFTFTPIPNDIYGRSIDVINVKYTYDDTTISIKQFSLSTIQHEFCHVLGMQHTHQIDAPENKIIWNEKYLKDNVYTVAKYPKPDIYDGTAEEYAEGCMKANITDRYKNLEYHGSVAFDTKSIMNYEIPCEWTQGGYFGFFGKISKPRTMNHNYKFSYNDKIALRNLYGALGPEPVIEQFEYKNEIYPCIAKYTSIWFLFFIVLIIGLIIL